MDDGSSDFSKSNEAAVYTGPRDYRTQGRHGVTPELSHDDCERFNILAHVNRYAGSLLPTVRAAYEVRVEPRFVQERGRAPANRHEARKALLGEPIYQFYSALWRGTMEQRQQAGRFIALSQAEALAEKVGELTNGDDRLELDPSLKLPRYISEIDHHCMPGSYHSELFPGDVTTAASYDIGFFVTLGGGGSPWLNSCGAGLVAWLKQFRPDFKPRRILEVGTTMGHNALPLAEAYPDAEVVCVDLGAPVLRYGLARAKTLGVENVRFVQADATDLNKFEDESFDLIFSAMFLHEISFAAMRKIFKENYRLVKEGGLVIHLEQPGYNDEVPIIDQAMRDWHAFYNNEPFMSTLKDVDVYKYYEDAGFPTSGLFYGMPDCFVSGCELEGGKGRPPKSWANKLGLQAIGAEK